MKSLLKWMMREQMLVFPVWFFVVLFAWMLSLLWAAISLLSPLQARTNAAMLEVVFTVCVAVLFYKHFIDLPPDLRRRGFALDGVRQRAVRRLLGPSQEVLEDAAEEWEQLELLLKQNKLDVSQRTRLEKAANERMRRVFDYSTEIPGKFGLSAEAAREAILRDTAWLSRACRLLEELTLTPSPSGPDFDLEDLQRQVGERQLALRELLEDGGEALRVTA